MNMDVILSAASDTLVNVLLAVITLGGAYALYYLKLVAAKVKAQTAQIESQQARQLLDDALGDVLNLVSVGVGAMEQTTAKALRQAVKDGKADREKLLALGRQVLEEVTAAVETQAVITKHLGNFEDYVMKCIEDAVLKVKQADPMALAEGIVVDTVKTE